MRYEVSPAHGTWGPRATAKYNSSARAMTVGRSRVAAEQFLGPGWFLATNESPPPEELENEVNQARAAGGGGDSCAQGARFVANRSFSARRGQRPARHGEIPAELGAEFVAMLCIAVLGLG